MDEEPTHIRFLRGFLDPRNIRRYERVFKRQVEQLTVLMEDYFNDEIPPEQFLSQFASEIYGVKIWLKETQNPEEEHPESSG